MRWVLTTMVVLWTVAAAAQTTEPLSIRLAADTSLDSYRFRDPNTCADTLTFQWIYSGGVSPCGPLKLWATAGSCGAEPGSADLPYPDVQASVVTSTGRGTFSVVPGELPAFAAGSAMCGAAGVEQTHRLCAAMKYTSYLTCDQTLQFSGFEVVYDAKPPAAPAITAAVALDGSARLTFSAASDVTDIHAEVRAQGAADFTPAAADVSMTDKAVRISQLANGTTYDIQLRALDKAGNVSGPSALVSVTPVHTVGFWGLFRQMGGTEQGGCAAAGGAPLLWLALFAVRALSRRRSKT